MVSEVRRKVILEDLESDWEKVWGSFCVSNVVSCSGCVYMGVFTVWNSPASAQVQSTCLEGLVKLRPKNCVPSRFSRVQLWATLWSVAHQAPLSTDSPGENTGVGHHFLLQGIFLTPVIEPYFLTSPALAGRFFTTSATWEAPYLRLKIKFSWCLGSPGAQLNLNLSECGCV